MAKELTDAQKLRKARVLMVEAALDMTRLEPKMRRAMLLVHVRGYTPARAARRVGSRRQFVYRAGLVLAPKLAEVKAYIDAKVAS